MGHDTHGQAKPASEKPATGTRLAPVDQRMVESGLSPNELDQTDESLKAADITRAGEHVGHAGADRPGDAP